MAQHKLLAIEQNKVNQATAEGAKRYREIVIEMNSLDGAIYNNSTISQKQIKNIGNYTGANWALSNSINQLTREAPAFANSVNTGFMAISNNLPIMFDAVKQLKDQNKSLAAEGKATQSIFKALAGAIFSWGTLLSVGVTLLTFFGGSIVKYFSGEDSETKKATKNINEQTKAVETLTESIINQNTVQKNSKIEIDSVTQSEIDLLRAKEDVAEVLTKLKIGNDEYVKSLDEGQDTQEAWNKTLGFQKMTVSELMKEYEKLRLFDKQDIQSEMNAYILAIIKQKQIEQKIIDDANKIKAEKDKKLKDKLKKQQEEFNKHIQTMERLRLAALSLLDDDYQLKQDEIHKKHREAMTAIKNDDIMLQEEKTFYILALEKHMYKQIEESKKAHFDYMAKIQSDSIDSINAVELIKAKDNQRALTNLLIELETEKLAKLQNQETDGSQVQEKLKLQRIAEQEAKINGLKVNIQDLNYNQELDKALDNEDQIYEIKKTALNNALALTKDNADEEARIKKELFDLEQANNDRLLAQRVAIANQTLSIATSLSNAYKANEDKQLNKTTEANEKKKESLKAQMDAGIITQEKYNKEVAKLDKEADKQKAIIARKQAIRNRNLALFQITINTAEAVSKSGANPYLIALALAMGAAETAVVMNTEIPKASRGRYISGKSHASGGEIIEAEGGEVVINRKSVSMYRSQLSAINQAGGGVSFGNGGTIGFNDGGYSMRNNQYGMNGLTKADLVEALQGLTIVTTIEDIKREEKKYNKITSSGTF